MTIARLNERIDDLVKRFNREHHGDKTARLCMTDNSLTIQYVDIKRLRAEWIEEWSSLYYQDYNASCLVIDRDIELVIVAKATLKGKRYQVSIGEARCGPYDEYSDDAGFAIAYARACGEPIPDYI